MPLLTTPMLVAGGILVVTFTGIFTERVHGLDRARFALVGAMLMVGLGQYIGFYHPQNALDAIDWNVILLLLYMMTIVSIMIPTGGFQRLAFRISDVSRGRQFVLLALIGTAVTVISLLLDNVTTVVIFGPLVILITRAMGVTPIPYLLAIALLSDTGGVATLIGDPPNLIIGSAAGIDFNTFFLHMGGIVLAAWLVILAVIWILFRVDLRTEPGAPDLEVTEMTDAKTWRICVWTLGLMVGLFIAHDALGWQPWFVSMTGLGIILLFSRGVELSTVLQDVELGLLIFFGSLFIVVGGVESSGLLEWVGGFIQPFVEHDLFLATLVLMWVAAILSAMIDNIPFTVAMIPVIASIEAQGQNVTPLWWALSLGVGLGGNGTHLGSTANVYIVTLSERLARDTGNPALAITPGLWFRKGTPAMLATLVASSLLFWVFFEFFSKPI